MRCQNQLKQIGLGIHSYHDAFQRIPASSSGRGYSLFVTILPYVDQAPLWVSIPTETVVWPRFGSSDNAPHPRVVSLSHRSQFVVAVLP